MPLIGCKRPVVLIEKLDKQKLTGLCCLYKIELSLRLFIFIDLGVKNF